MDSSSSLQVRPNPLFEKVSSPISNGLYGVVFNGFIGCEHVGHGFNFPCVLMNFSPLHVAQGGTSISVALFQSAISVI